MPTNVPSSSIPIRTIVVPTDFSAPAGRALEWAIALATMHQARIVLVHAIHPSLFGAGHGVERVLKDAAAVKLEEASKPIVDARLSMATDCRVGKPWVVMREAVQAAKADLVVIGSRGLTGLDRLLLGSTTDRVLRTAAHPVLTVHPDDARPAFRRVLLATDFSESAKSALAVALQLLQNASRPVHLTLLHVSMPPYVVGSLDVAVSLMPDWDAVDQEARQNLDVLAAAVRSEHVEVTTEVVRGSPVHAILELAKSRHADLIAVGTRGATGLDRFLLGSTAERVIHHATCPVLTTHLPVTAEDGGEHEARGHATTKGTGSFAAR